jgi:hypothetical protein
MLSWRRIRFTLGISIVFGLLISIHGLPPWNHWKPGFLAAVACTVLLGLGAVLMFGLFEQWPKRLPRWLERWVLQVGRGPRDAHHHLDDYSLDRPRRLPFYQVRERIIGFDPRTLDLIAPWVALGALVRQRRRLREIRRSPSISRAASSSARLGRAPAPAPGADPPHFLFNTLAGMQALVDGLAAGRRRAAEPRRVPAPPCRA